MMLFRPENFINRINIKDIGLYISISILMKMKELSDFFVITLFCDQFFVEQHFPQIPTSCSPCYHGNKSRNSIVRPINI